MSVSIVIPTYNRKVFERLIEHNINTQDYFNILEVIILDDSDDGQRPLCLNTIYPIHYRRVPRCSIGMKRNFGVILAKGEYIAFQDSDDFYSPEYISYSIFEMETNNKSIAGSADMNVYNGEFFKQSCMFIHLLNEATMVFKKSAWTNFADSNSNEAVPFLEKNIKNIIETNIDRVMCCVSHKTNTIDKKQWCVDTYKRKPMPQYSKHIQILSTLNV
jgi:glycosyltransferase involved in cell wall biosynthesis